MSGKKKYSDEFKLQIVMEYYRHIDSMLARCKKDFGQGVFKDKIAHEIG